MSAATQLLKADIQRDLRAIETIYHNLARFPAPLTDEDQAIVAGFQLHNLYSAFESIFQRIAETFENQISDQARWHAELLRRMTLDIEDIRPRVISEEAYECLDELRRFRHLFRGLYRSRLDSERLALVQRKASKLESLYRTDLALFVDFLESIA